MPYRVEWRPAAARALRKLPQQIQKRIGAKVDALAEAPRPPDAVKLSGEKNVWRVRVGAYRILYIPEEALLLVLVVDVGHRREVYRRQSSMEPAPRLELGTC